MAQNWQSLKAHSSVLLDHHLLASYESISKLRDFGLLLRDYSFPTHSHTEVSVP